LKPKVINTIKVTRRESSRNNQLIRKYMTPEPQTLILHQDTFTPNLLNLNDDIGVYTKSTLKQPKSIQKLKIQKSTPKRRSKIRPYSPQNALSVLSSFHSLRSPLPISPTHASHNKRKYSLFHSHLSFLQKTADFSKISHLLSPPPPNTSPVIFTSEIQKMFFGLNGVGFLEKFVKITPEGMFVYRDESAAGRGVGMQMGVRFGMVDRV
jgi:hypothetical protein